MDVYDVCMDTAHDIPFTIYLLCTSEINHMLTRVTYQLADIHINLVENKVNLLKRMTICIFCKHLKTICTLKSISFRLFTTTVAVYFKTLDACDHIKG